MLSKRSLTILFFFSLLALLTYQGTKAAVDLLYFRAVPQENEIVLEWETATEFDNAGFYVTRNTSPAPPYDAISEFIPAEGEGVIGAQYEFIDNDVVGGVLYYYILEAIDVNQGVETHGPITATLDEQPGNTPVPTITNTPTTPTQTPTVSNTPKTSTPKTSTPTSTRTPTKTHTPVPTRTSTSAPPTISPTPFTETSTPSATPTITPSPTLLDAPEIVLVLPATNTPLPTIAPVTPMPSPTPTPARPLEQWLRSGSLLVIGAICLLVLVWAAIAVGIFIYIQKRNP